MVRPVDVQSVRAFLLASIDKLSGPLCVFLSAGVDSTSLLLAAIDCRKDVSALTFMLDHQLSTDARLAMKNAKRLGVPCKVVLLPRDPLVLFEDARTLITEYGAKGKAEIECAWPMFRAMQETNCATLVTGHAADGVFGTGRRATIDHRGEKDAGPLDVTRDAYYARPNLAQRMTLRRIAKTYGKVMSFPYMDSDEWRELFRGKTWGDVNLPREKEALRRAFTDRVRGLEVKPHSNLQLGDSGIAKRFQRLTQYLPGSKSPVKVYNAIREGRL